jgi:CRP-like cAMP-binding protein
VSRDLELFKGLLDAEVREVLGRCEVLQSRAGDAILGTERDPQALYVLLEGEVEVDLHVPGLGEHALLKLVPQESFGEVTFFAPGPHTASAQCVTNAQLLRLTRDAFDQLREEAPLAAGKLAVNAATILARRLAVTDRWLSDLLRHSAEEGVAAAWRSFRTRLTTTPHHAGGVGAFPGAW